MLKQITDRSLIQGINRNLNPHQNQVPSDYESSQNQKQNPNLQKKTNLQKINNYAKRIENIKKNQDSQNDKIQNFSFQEYDFTGLKVSDKKRNVNEQTFFGDFKGESDQKIDEFGEFDDELNILSKQIMEIDNDDFIEFEQNLKNEEIYLEFDELMEFSKDLQEIDQKEEKQKTKFLKLQTNKNIQADSYCSSVFQNLQENQMNDISSLSQSLDGSNFDQALVNDMPSQIIMQDHSNDQIYNQNDQSSFIFSNCQKNDLYQKNQSQNFQKLFSNVVKKFDFQNLDLKQQDQKKNKQNIQIVKNIIKEQNNQIDNINIGREDQLESGPKIAKNLDINGSSTLRTFRQNSNDIKSKQKIKKSEETTKSKKEECGTEIEEELEYFEGINLGEMENEPNTVIKYEQQSSEQQLNTEEVGVFNNQDGITQYHITQGNSVLIRSNFLSSSQSHSNVFTTHLQNNLYTQKTTAVQSSIQKFKESSVTSAASNHQLQEQTLNNPKNTYNLQVEKQITEKINLVQMNEMDDHIKIDENRIDIKENEKTLDELKNRLKKVLINFREQKEQLIILPPKQKKQEEQEKTALENEQTGQHEIMSEYQKKDCDLEDEIKEEASDMNPESKEELEQVNSLKQFGNIVRQNINTRLPRLEANEEAFSSTNSFRNSTSQEKSSQSNQFVSPNIQVQQLSQQNFENTDKNSPIHYEYKDQLNQTAPENESFQNIKEFIKNPQLQQQSKKEQLQKLLLENQKIMEIMQAKNKQIQNQGYLNQQYLSNTQRVSKTLLNQMITQKQMNKQKNKSSKQNQQDELCLSKHTSNANQPANAYNMSFSLNNSRATVKSTCALKKVNRTSILGKHKFKSIDHSSHSIHQKKITFNDQQILTHLDNTQQIQSNYIDQGNGFSQGPQNIIQSQNDIILNTNQSNSNVNEVPQRKNLQQENRKNKISNNIKMMKNQFIDSENISYLNETKKQGKLSQTSQNISHKNSINLSQKNNHIIQSTVNTEMRKIGFPVTIFNQDSANIDSSNICKIDLTSKNEQFHTSKARRTTTADLKIKNQKKRVGQNKTTTAWHSNGFGAQQIAGMQKRQNNSVSRTHRKIQQQNIAVQKSQANLIYLKSKSNAILDNETLLSNQNRKKSPKIKNPLHTLNKNSSNEISNSRFSKNKTQKSISFLKKKISLGQMMMFNINQDGNKGFSASYQDHGCNYKNNINKFSSNISSNDFNIQQGEFNCKIFKQLSTANNLANQDQRNEFHSQNEFVNKQKVNQDQNKKLLKVNHQSSSSFSSAIFQTKSNQILNNLGIQQLSASAEIRRQINENKDFPSSYNSIKPIQNIQMNNMKQQQAFLFSPNNFTNDKILFQNEGMFSVNKSQQFENLKAITSKTKNKNLFKNQNLISSETVESKHSKKMQIKSQKKNSIQLSQINEFSPNRNINNINQKTWRDSSQLKKQKPTNKYQQKPKEGELSSSLHIMAEHQNSKLLNSGGKSGTKKMGSFKMKNGQQIASNNQIISNMNAQHHQNQNIQNGNEFQNEAMNYYKTLQFEKQLQLLEQQNQLHLQKQESRKAPQNISTSHRSSKSIHKFNKHSSKNTKKQNTEQNNDMKKKKSSKTLQIQQEMYTNLRNQLISNIMSPSESLYLQQQAFNLQEMQENINSNNVPYIQITDNQTSYLDESVQKQANPFQKQKFKKQMKNYLGNNNQFKNNDVLASLRYSQELKQ